MMKVGRRCIWDEIKVGEVFACNIYWSIFYKISNDTCQIIASTNHRYPYKSLDEYDGWILNWDSLYKLPISVQRLWKEE